MRVILMPEAEEVLLEISEFIESINTEGSGKRWLDKIQFFLTSYAKSNVVYALCQNEDFALSGLSCITYNGWIIAFKIEEDLFVVYKIIRGSILF
jgi:hypothetical protein